MDRSRLCADVDPSCKELLRKACHSHPAEDDRSHPAEDDRSHPAEDDRNHPAEDDRSHPAEDAGHNRHPVDADRSHPAGDDRNRPAEDDRSHPVGAGHNHPDAADRSHHRYCSCYVGDSLPEDAEVHCSANLRRIPLGGTRLRRCYCDSWDAHILGVQRYECVDVVNDLDDTPSDIRPVQSLPVFSRCFRNP